MLASTAFLAGILLVDAAPHQACRAGPIDLSAAAAASAQTPFTWVDSNEDFEYSLTVCGTSVCGDTNSSVCQKSLNYPPITSLCSWDETATWTATPDGATTEFKNGAMCNGEASICTVNVHCQDKPTALVSVSVDKACHHNVELNAQCGPPVCKRITSEATCNGASGGSCHWCSSSVVGAGCYSESEAGALPPSTFTCDYKHCSDNTEQKKCDGAFDGGPKPEACLWCQRLGSSNTTAADSGDCVSKSKAAGLPPSVFKCA